MVQDSLLCKIDPVRVPIKGGLGFIYLDTIVLRKPKARDIIGLDFSTANASINSFLRVVSTISGLPVSVVQDLSARDWVRIHTMVAMEIFGVPSAEEE